MASPQTHESARSFGRDPVGVDPGVADALRQARPAVGKHDLSRAKEVHDVRVGSPQRAELVAVVDQVLLHLLEFIRGQLHRLLDSERQSGLGYRGQRIVRLQRHPIGELRVEQVLERVDLAGFHLGRVVDEALRAGRERDQHRVLPIEHAWGVREDQVIPVGDPVACRAASAGSAPSTGSSRPGRPRPRRPRSHLRALPRPPGWNRSSRSQARGRGWPRGRDPGGRR